MQCPERERNLKDCNCSYGGCEKKGKCCDCLRYHLRMSQLPACAFPDDVERTYDRSFKNFARLVNNNLV
ncbi:MAG: cytosolic protein [Kiritimatiellaeota bacterium]|nr:cytosolic protein [Kiritimatiellota bacterium]